MAKNKELSSEISPELSEKLFKRHLDTESMRQKIISIFNEQIRNVDFANTIKEYAAEEMDKRVFRSAKYWVIVVGTAIITSVVAVLISKSFSS